jgi:hypothetical protein
MPQLFDVKPCSKCPAPSCMEMLGEVCPLEVNIMDRAVKDRVRAIVSAPFTALYMGMFDGESTVIPVQCYLTTYLGSWSDSEDKKCKVIPLSNTHITFYDDSTNKTISLGANRNYFPMYLQEFVDQSEILRHIKRFFMKVQERNTRMIMKHSKMFYEHRPRIHGIMPADHRLYRD